jgi:hypothetical protein
VAEFARAHGLVLFSDEVYRELEHDPDWSAARRLRPVRTGGLAWEHLQDLRAARAAARVAGHPRRGAAGRPPSAEGLRPTASPIGLPRVHGVSDVDEFCAPRERRCPTASRLGLRRATARARRLRTREQAHGAGDARRSARRDRHRQPRSISGQSARLTPSSGTVPTSRGGP